MPQPLCMKRKMRRPKFSIVCFLGHHKPTNVKSDSASECHTQQLREVLKKPNVQKKLHSNEHQ